MTNDEAMEYYQKRCEHFADLLSIREWDIQSYKLKELDSDFAATHFEDIGLSAIAVLDSSDPDEWTEELLNDTACHEMVELLLAKCRMIMSSRYNITPDTIERELHSVINRLVRLLREK